MESEDLDRLERFANFVLYEEHDEKPITDWGDLWSAIEDRRDAGVDTIADSPADIAALVQTLVQEGRRALLTPFTAGDAVAVKDEDGDWSIGFVVGRRVPPEDPETYDYGVRWAMSGNVTRSMSHERLKAAIRCTRCLDRPGFNGLGTPCRECKGVGYVPPKDEECVATSTSAAGSKPA